jgi:hypothetical protein
MRRKFGFFFLISLLLYALFASWPVLARKKGETVPKTVSLILAAGPEQAGFDRLAPTAKRYRDVTINEFVLEPGAVAPGDRIVITLFANEYYVVVIDRASVDVNETLSLRGRLEGMEEGYLLLSSSMGRVLASISVPDANKRYRKYWISYNPLAKTHFMQEIAPEMRPVFPHGPSPIPPLAPQDKGDNISPLLNAAQVTIDVMVVYTPAAKTLADTDPDLGGINNVINQAILGGQYTLDSSATDITFRLVHSAEIDYAESGSLATDLNRLTNPSDGYMDSVHQWRNLYGADLVSLFTSTGDYAGFGWELHNPAGSPDHCFSVCRADQAVWGDTLIHELGHNMGCGHYKYQRSAPGPGIFSYSAGWRWVGTELGWCWNSIMTYCEPGCYDTAFHFSNPNVTHDGVATGHPVDADNARSLRELKGVIANYRPSATNQIIKNDFNRDGRDDILWRYYGSGGYNVVWYLGDSGGGLARMGGTITERPMGEYKSIDMLQGQGSERILGDPREAGGLLTEKAAQRVFRDPREVGGLMTRADAQTQRGVPTMRDPGEIGGAGVNGVPVMRVTGATWIGNGWLPAVPDTSWEIGGTGDFNADGNVDILWRNYSLGYNLIWYMNGVDWIGNGWLPAVTDAAWRIAGTGDFNADGNVDILWRDYGLGYNVIWYMDGVTWIDNGWLPAVTDTNWKMEGTGDFDGNGKVDILWRYYGAGGYDLVWYMDGVTWIDNGWLPAVTDTNWKMEGTGDFDGNGKVDILWRDYGLGYNVIWYMDGVTWIDNGWLPTEPDINWRIENH